MLSRRSTCAVSSPLSMIATTTARRGCFVASSSRIARSALIPGMPSAAWSSSCQLRGASRSADARTAGASAAGVGVVTAVVSARAGAGAVETGAVDLLRPQAASATAEESAKNESGFMRGDDYDNGLPRMNTDRSSIRVHPCSAVARWRPGWSGGPDVGAARFLRAHHGEDAGVGEREPRHEVGAQLLAHGGALLLRAPGDDADLVHEREVAPQQHRAALAQPLERVALHPLRGANALGGERVPTRPLPRLGVLHLRVPAELVLLPHRVIERHRDGRVAEDR